MRTLSGRSRARQRTNWARQVAPCPGVNHHEQVSVDRPHTKEFSQQARDTLGLAFMRAREAAGHTWLTFIEVAKIGRTSLFKLENGVPVGPKVYEAAARALRDQGWTPDTPVSILRGEPAPESALQPQVEGVWTQEDENLLQAVTLILKQKGLEPTRELVEAMQEEVMRLRAEQRAERDRSSETG